MTQSNRKTQVISFSADVITVERIKHMLEHHFGNRVNQSDLLIHAINDMYHKLEFAEQSGLEVPVPQGRWG